MNVYWIDWVILFGMIALVCGTGFTTRRHTRSVADFLVANRTADKYLLGVADGIAGLCAITVVGFFELHYKSGFCGIWWNAMLLPVGVIVSLTGWVQYRYRQTRAMTMAQFMEMRYSRRFRVFAGVMCWFSGVLNFGIFPAVGGRFFQYYLGLPPVMVSFGIAEIDVVYAAIMTVLLTISLVLVFWGGQIAIMVTDYVQGTFCNLAFCGIAAYLLFYRFDWAVLTEAFAQAPKNASLINPAHSGSTENYSPTYFLISVFGTVLNWMAWQGNQGFFGAARSPHAARMGRLVSSFRPIIQSVALVLMAVGAYALMHHPGYAAEAARVNGALAHVANPTIQSQQTVGIALVHLLPMGLLGIFAAVMFAAFVSTHEAYMHSWGSIFIQDVLLPIRQLYRGDDAPLDPKTHFRLLKLSICGVSVFIFFFSLFFTQRQDVFMFFALTGTFYIGWAGWTIVGGLYWKYGNTTGAWAGALTGLTLSILGWALTFQWEWMQSILGAVMPASWQGASQCPLNGQTLYFWSMVFTGAVYGGVSLLAGRQPFPMDRMLHRGEYALVDEGEQAEPARGWATLKMTPEFEWDDKLLYLLSMLYTLVFFGLFVAGTLAFTVFRYDFSDAGWATFWWYYCVAVLALSSLLAIWFAIGGTRDLSALYRRLGAAKRDATDDGSVHEHLGNEDLDS